MALSSGTRLGSYEIVEPLGAGGMGDVYRARDPRLKRDVALKVLPPELASEPERLERFEREAQTLATLNHPHIVTIFSVEEAEDLRFLTMELVEGDDGAGLAGAGDDSLRWPGSFPARSMDPLHPRGPRRERPDTGGELPLRLRTRVFP